MARHKICTLCQTVFIGNKTRCANCERRWEAQRWQARPQYHGAWRTIAAKQVERQPFCVDCGATNNLTADHVVPVSKGGDNSEGNLVTRCRPCNSAKGNR